MSKFKRGDRVRVVVVDGSDLEKGSVHTVSVVDGVLVGLDGSKIPQWLGSRFEKAYPNPPHKHAELITAWAWGAEIEVYYRHNGWSRIEVPSWGDETIYRIKSSNPNAEKIAEIGSTISQLQQQVKELKHAD